MALESIPGFPTFRRLKLEDKPGIEHLFELYPTEVSERTFGSVFVWRGYEHRSELSQLDGHLIISWFRSNLGRIMLQPVGPDPVGVVEALGRPDNAEASPFAGVYGIVEPEATKLRNLGIQVDSLRDEWDYVYSVEDLVRLEGPKYHTQRKEMKKARLDHELTYEPMTQAHQKGCLELEETWCNLKQCTFERLSAAEDRALKEALLNMDQIRFIGGVVLLEGRIQALAVGERLNRDTAVVHFEKANPEIRGIYQIVNQQFCVRALGGFSFVNREQDVGEPGLRRAKEGYHPHHFVEKHMALLR
ncbi:MAG TPA: phosphatidylglycerol lysyltransferase domain-containing protein [Thermoplasmata archaeon]